MNNIEEEFDEILSDINNTNDEFVNTYFDEETGELTQETNSEEKYDNEYSNVEIIDNIKTNGFSYNEILDKLDPKIDLNNADDILNLIEKSADSDDFFDTLEELNDK